MYIHVSDSCQVWQKPNLLLFGTGGIRAASESVPPEYTAHRQVFLMKNSKLKNVHGSTFFSDAIHGGSDNVHPCIVLTTI